MVLIPLQETNRDSLQVFLCNELSDYVVFPLALRGGGLLLTGNARDSLQMKHERTWWERKSYQSRLNDGLTTVCVCVCVYEHTRVRVSDYFFPHRVRSLSTDGEEAVG